MPVPFPGHLRAATHQRYVALWALLQHYDEFDAFVTDAHAARQEYERRLANAPGPPTMAHWEARAVVRALARRWNLDRINEIREFDYFTLALNVQRVGDSVGRTVLRPFTFFGTGGMEPENPEVRLGDRRWEWHLGRFETLADFRDRIVRDLDLANARSLPNDIQEQLRALPQLAKKEGWKLEDARHGGVWHVQWLFLRLCPQPDQPWSARQIVQEESAALGVHLDERTVRRAINDLATLLKIDLPPLRSGRPRKPRADSDAAN